MQRIGLVFPESRSTAVEAAAHAQQLLSAEGITVLDEQALNASPAIDALITIGGDGTLLRGAKMALASKAPVLGINLGHTGFLTECEADDLDNAIQALLNGTYTIEERSLLEVTCNGQTSLALNDCAVCRGGYSRLITLSVASNGQHVGYYRGDGLVIATPTGATGYSLSAGGPLVSPDVDCMLITPICAHSIQNRPVVVSGSAKLILRLHDDSEMTACLQMDGQQTQILQSGDTIAIQKSSQKVQLVRLGEKPYFDIVRAKLSEWMHM